MSKTITNIHNLPEPLFNAIALNTYRTGGDISVTTLCGPPQERMLKKQYDITEDVSDMVWAMLGTATHEILCRANISDFRKRAFLTVIDTLKQESKATNEDQYNRCADYLFKLLPTFFPELKERYIFEKTIQIEVQGKVLAGTFDLFDTETKRLKDYKITSVFSYIYPEARAKWFAQTNIYSYMLEMNGIEVKGIDIVAIFRDFSESKKLGSRDYPPTQVLEIEVPLWSMEVRQQFIEARMKLHVQAELGNIPPCTGADKWSKATIWAFMPKAGAKKAIKLFDTEAAALNFKMEQGHNYMGGFIEKRLGTNTKCDLYCSVRNVCEQRKRELTENK